MVHNFRKEKQVRFAYNLTNFHSSPDISEAFLASSIPSSTSLKPPSPYNAAYFSPSTPRPHPLLEPSAINWNMMDHFSTIGRDNNLRVGQVLYERATTPPLPFLSITSIHLPWSIDVYASNGSYVTLGDVFNCIYRSLRANITTTEFNSFPQQGDQVRATRAYEQRYRRFRNTFGHNEEKQSGMKRIDYLMSNTMFHGISKFGHYPDQWQLNVLPLNA